MEMNVYTAMKNFENKRNGQIDLIKLEFRK